MKVWWIVILVFIFIVPCARGDPINTAELMAQIRQQNELMSDLLQLYQAGYDPAKTEIAALLEHKKIEKYLNESSETSRNTGEMLAKMDGLKQSIDSIDSKLETFETRLTKEEMLSGQHQVMIDRNVTDISRIFYVIAVVSGFLASAAWAGHSWAHRNDNRGG